eukprot:15071106-Alexandrium_andersonii.AAC.1
MLRCPAPCFSAGACAVNAPTPLGTSASAWRCARARRLGSTVAALPAAETRASASRGLSPFSLCTAGCGWFGSG